MRHGRGDVVGIDEDDIEPLMDLSWNALGIFEQVLATDSGFGLFQIIIITIDAISAAVIVVVIGKASLISSEVLNLFSKKLKGKGNG